MLTQIFLSFILGCSEEENLTENILLITIQVYQDWIAKTTFVLSGTIADDVTLQRTIYICFAVCLYWR